ncbi:unnamed protein product [Phytomonas sp. EM1]|nr:unnamed protein product [Phytomonas sp. EM1]|eukprot:CCW64107.1 unnamed protein product [Phytomonas sp. isolate EM1]
MIPRRGDSEVAVEITVVEVGARTRGRLHQDRIPPQAPQGATGDNAVNPAAKFLEVSALHLLHVLITNERALKYGVLDIPAVMPRLHHHLRILLPHVQLREVLRGGALDLDHRQGREKGREELESSAHHRQKDREESKESQMSDACGVSLCEDSTGSFFLLITRLHR